MWQSLVDYDFGLIEQIIEQDRLVLEKRLSQRLKADGARP